MATLTSALASLSSLDPCEPSSSSDDEALSPGSSSSYRVQLSFFGTLFTHLEAWVTPETGRLADEHALPLA